MQGISHRGQRVILPRHCSGRCHLVYTSWLPCLLSSGFIFIRLFRLGHWTGCVSEPPCCVILQSVTPACHGSLDRTGWVAKTIKSHSEHESANGQWHDQCEFHNLWLSSSPSCFTPVILSNISLNPPYVPSHVFIPHEKMHRDRSSQQFHTVSWGVFIVNQSDSGRLIFLNNIQLTVK